MKKAASDLSNVKEVERLKSLASAFSTHTTAWSEWEALATKGELYFIEMLAPAELPARSVADGRDRSIHTFGTVVLCQLIDKATAAARLVPVGAYLKQQRPNPGSNGEDKMYSSLECTSKSAWAQVVLRSLTAINNYGIWSGHVLYWHMIPATLSWLQRNALQPDHPRRPASARLQT